MFKPAKLGSVGLSRTRTTPRLAAAAISGLLLMAMTQASFAVGPPPGSHRPPAPPPVASNPHPAPPPSTGRLPNGSNSGLKRQ